MAATLFFPPPSLPSSNPHHIPDVGVEVDEDISPILSTHHLLHHTCTEGGQNEVSDVANVSPANSPHSSVEGDDDEEDEEGEEVEEEVEEVEEGEVCCQPSVNNPNPSNTLEDDQNAGGTGVDLGTLIGRRVTLKPRRTLSLSPTPARAGDMMARNLRAARWLDFTNEDDDDGLYQHSDSDSEAKKKPGGEETNIGSGFGKVRVTTRRGGSLTLGAMTGLSRDFLSNRRGSSSMKRPLEVTLPCQEIQYLDISYQKVGIHTVQFSPIPRKKIAYHPVPYHAIHYCDVPYLGERPVKRKPPA
ncbi:UNVERIFIED_CONTAM: hypothetical protein RMT77_003251 [Armadillidium vulgare]